MSKSILGTITRQSTDTVWPFFIFYEANDTNFDVLDGTTKCQTYMKGNPDTDLVLYVQHVFEDEAFYETYKDTANQHIPLWKTTANASEVESYMTANNVTVDLEELTNPDLSGYTLISEVDPESTPDEAITYYENKK